MDIDIHLGGRLRDRRLLLNWTQGELGIAIGVGSRQIQKYECGLIGMSASRLWRLSQALDVSLSYFYAGLEDR